MIQSTALFVFVTCKNDLLFVKFISFVSHMNGRLLILSLWAAFQIVWASWFPNVRISWIHPHSQRVRRNLCTMHVQSITNSENNTKIKHLRLTFSQILLFSTLCLSHQKIYTHCQLQSLRRQQIPTCTMQSLWPVGTMNSTRENNNIRNLYFTCGLPMCTNCNDSSNLIKIMIAFLIISRTVLRCSFFPTVRFCN